MADRSQGSTDRSAQQEDHERKPEAAPIDRNTLADRSRGAPIVHPTSRTFARAGERNWAETAPVDRGNQPTDRDMGRSIA